jgi:hypothetical protein
VNGLLVAMKETPLFRNIQHIPRIWGVTYIKLFGSLGLGLLLTTGGFLFTNRATAVVKLVMIGSGVILTAMLYAVSFWLDNQDPLESDSARFLKNELNSVSLSLQQIRFHAKEGSDEVSRSAQRQHQQVRTEAGKRSALR